MVASRDLSAARRALESCRIGVESLATGANLPPLYVEKILSGKEEIAPTHALTGQMARRLVNLALAGWDRGRRDRLLTLARRLNPDTFTTTYEAAERGFAVQEVEKAHKRRLKGPGFIVAPYLSPNGKFVLLAINEKHELGCSAEVTDLGGSVPDVVPENTWDNPHWVDPEWLDASDVVNPDNAEFYGHQLFEPGVRVAPWRPWGSPIGVCLLAIDKKLRLVARTDVRIGLHDPAAVLAAWKAMRMALDIAPDAPSFDITGDEDDPDDPRFDAWKRGKG